MRIKNAAKALSEKEIKAIVENDKESKSKRIKQLFDHGLEIKEIAKIMGIRYNFAYNVISNYILINDIEVIQEKETKKSAAFKLFDQGKSIKEVVSELKMNYNHAWKIFQEWKKEAEEEAKQTTKKAAQ